MSSSWKAPPKLKEPYSTWKTELEIWENFTEIEKKKQGGALFLSLPNPSSARDAALELGSTVINSDNGVKAIVEKLDSLFLKDDNILTYQAWKAFIHFKRCSSMNMTDYTIEFNRLYIACKAKKLEVPTGVLAIQFLESANLSEGQHRLALATCDKMEYDVMKAQVLKISTDLVVPSTSQILQPNEIKVEKTTLHTEYGDAFADQEAEEYQPPGDDEEEEYSDTLYGYSNWNNHGASQRRPWNRGYSRRPFRPGVAATARKNQETTQGSWRGGYSRPPQQNRYQDLNQKPAAKNKQPNPADRYGRPQQCRECLSIYHFEDSCPELAGNIVLLTDEVMTTSTLLEETIGCMVVDSGCIHTVCGKVWLESYIDSLSCKDRKSILVKESTSRFRFGNGASFSSMKKVTIPVYLGTLRARIETDVVQCEIPLLFSKNSLKKGHGSINFTKDTIQILDQNLKLGNTSTGHYVLRLSRNPESSVAEVSDVLFNVNLEDMDSSRLRATAKKWHKQFTHPPAAKLIDLLSRANIKHPDIAKIITEVSETCDICLRYRKPPNKPVVAFPLANRFNETVAMDLKDIRPGLKIIHLIDHATRYSQAAIVNNKSSTEIVRKIFDLWIRVFGCPDQFLTDNGGEFNNHEFLDLCDKCNIKVLTTAAESPWSNGLAEKHNGILGQIVIKMLDDQPMASDIALHWAVAAKNALTTVYGFSPNVLVFGRDPTLPNVMENSIPANDPQYYSNVVRENLEALHRARESFIHQESSEKLARALNKQTRTYSDRVFMNNDNVFYKRDHSAKWQGPAKVLGRDHNQILIKHGGSYLRVHPCRLLPSEPSDEDSGEERNFESSDKVKDMNITHDSSDDEALIPKTAEHNSEAHPGVLEHPIQENRVRKNQDNSTDEPCHEEEPRQQDDGHNEKNEKTVPKKSDMRTLSHVVPKKNQVFNYRFVGTDETRKATCLGRGGKAKTPTWHYINIKDHASGSQHCVSVRDDIESWEVCSDPSETLLSIEADIFAGSKQAEMDKWKKMKVYTEVEDLGQKRIGTRWVCTERLKGGNIETKARLCARGCEDPEDVVTDSPTCEKDNVRVLLSIAASHSWEIHSIDFKSAYLQGEDLDRDIFLTPPAEANTNKLWKLKKCVYGINDAGRKWYNQLRHDLTSLGAEVSSLDQAVFFKREQGKLAGIIVLHVDDTLWAGNQNFSEQFISKLTTNLLISTEEHRNMRYLGLSLSSEEGALTINLNHYAEKMEEIPINPERSDEDVLTPAELKNLRTLSGQINWLATQCRPDLSFNSCHVACSIKEGKIKDARAANKVLRRAKGMHYSIHYSDMGDPSSWKILGFSDASWGNISDGGSQGGFLVFVTGETGVANLISWQSRRLRRVARSTIAAETLAASDACETCILLSSQIAEIMGMEKLPIVLVTDNESLANATRSTTSVEEKRLRIDIAALREMVNSKEIHDIRWVPTEHQLADCLTKQGAKSDKLMAVIQQQMRLNSDHLRFTPPPWSG